MKRITKLIDHHTPLVIINGLADAYGLGEEYNEGDLDQLIDEINRSVLIISNKWDRETYGLVAQFVNLDCRKIWQKDRLLIAYNDIVNFDVNNIKSPYRFEHRSNKHPNSLDPVACYLICQHHHITLNPDVTYV